jgi:hypothetical protein
VLSGAFAPGPLGHGGVLSVVVFALVWVPRTHVPPVSLLVSLGFDGLAPSPCRALGREISQWWWCHPFRKWFHYRHLPSGLGMNRAIGWVSPALAGALCQLRGGDDMDFCQLAYNLSTPSVEGGGSAFRGMAIAVSVCPPPPCDWRREPLPLPDLGWRRGPASGSSLPRAWVHATAALCGCATMVVYLPLILLHHCAALCSALAC